MEWMRDCMFLCALVFVIFFRYFQHKRVRNVKYYVVIIRSSTFPL
jgi:hypothetical protein